MQLFSCKGYEAVSPNDICERAGITKPTLYHFFGNKEGLFDELLKEQYAKLDAAVLEACVYVPDIKNYENDVKPLLVNVATVFFKFVEENKDFYLLLLALGFAPPQSTSAITSIKYHKRHYEILTNMFSSIANAHPNMSGRESAYAMRFLALINAQIGMWYRGFAHISDDEAKSIARGFLHGIYNK